MNTDIALVAGALFALLAIPSLVTAFSESRPPRSAAILAVLGGGLILYATTQHAGGYSIGELPDVVVRVIGNILN